MIAVFLAEPGAVVLVMVGVAIFLFGAIVVSRG